MTLRTALAAAAHWDDLWPTVGEPDLINANTPVRFTIAPRGASWEVFRNTRFWGVYIDRHEALANVRSAIQSIYSDGGAAQLLAAA